MKRIALAIVAATLLSMPVGALADDRAVPNTPSPSILVVEGPLIVLDAHGTVVGQLVPTSFGDFLHFQAANFQRVLPTQPNVGIPQICPPKGYTLDVARAIEWSASDDLITPLSQCAP